MRVDPSKVIPTSNDTSERWIAFHKALKSWFGKSAANAYFVKFWAQRAGAGSSADTHDLRTYMESQGVDLTTNFKGKAVDFGAGIVDWFSDTVNIVRTLLVGTVIVGVAVIAYYIVKSAGKGKSSVQSIESAPLTQGKFFAGNSGGNPALPSSVNSVKLLS